MAGPHAVTELIGPTRAFAYDANGNFALGTDEPTITWSSYNKPTQLTKGAITYSFDYGPGRARYRKQNGSETTYYVDGKYEHRFGAGF